MLKIVFQYFPGILASLLTHGYVTPKHSRNGIFIFPGNAFPLNMGRNFILGQL
jgi:hypothetical protein